MRAVECASCDGAGVIEYWREEDGEEWPEYDICPVCGNRGPIFVEDSCGDDE